MTTHPHIPPRSDLRWAAVDFDGTLAVSTWSPENPTASPGAPIYRNVIELRKLAHAGFKIVVHTSRPWADHEIVKSWMEHYGLPFHSIVCGKLLAAAYIDDRAVAADSNNWLGKVEYLAAG